MSLRSMERELACQRQQVIIEPIAEAFCDAWEQTAAGEIFDPRYQPDPYQPLPEITVRVAQTTLADIDLLRAVTEAGALILAPGPVTHYLAQCRRDKRTPDPRPQTHRPRHRPRLRRNPRHQTRQNLPLPRQSPPRPPHQR